MLCLRSGTFPLLIHRAAIDLDTPQTAAAARTEPPGTSISLTFLGLPSRQPFALGAPDPSAPANKRVVADGSLGYDRSPVYQSALFAEQVEDVFVPPLPPRTRREARSIQLLRHPPERQTSLPMIRDRFQDCLFW
jgi:hypothetical protein